MSQYDAIVVGAGMSGLAAGIRLAMFDKKVLIVEKHFLSGGLNSFYRRGGFNFDVGLHALTNFATKGERRRPLTKLLKSLRIPYDSLELSEQSHSRVVFPERELTFTNDFAVLENSIAEEFPHEIDGFRKLVEKLHSENETALDRTYQSAKEVLGQYIKDPKLIHMIMCPLLIYGSAWEDDMDWSQFIIMFKSIFVEGFSRPKGGVRTIINLLLKKYKELGGEIKFKTAVSEFITKDGKIQGVRLANGDELLADTVLSSIGHPETLSMVSEFKDKEVSVGKLSFTETIIVAKQKPADFGIKDTIIFFNEREDYQYRRPNEYYDPKSAVICFPNNYQHDDFDEGWFRLTHMANYPQWKQMPKEQYLEHKQFVKDNALRQLRTFMPTDKLDVLCEDIFSPTTIERYTSHFSGTVYGSEDKLRDGRTPIKGLAIIGTDQGFLGIVGACLSGISMANLHGLMEGQQ